MLALIPSSDFGWLTKIGEKTLYVYLLHGFIIQPFRELYILWYNHWYETFRFVLLSALIVILLSSSPVVALTQPLVELEWKE